MKKLTALISAIVLTVCAVPANVCAIPANDEKLDWNNDGVVTCRDGYYFINYMEYIENRPITDFSKNSIGIDIENYITSEGGTEEINKKRDLNDDGIIDKRDFVIFGQLSRDYVCSIVYGDVNQDGRVDAVDGYMLKYYFEEGNEDYYSATQISLFETRGDANEDGIVDMADADFILNGGYAEKLHSSTISYDQVGTLSLEEYLASDTDSGDVNHDGFIDARDACIVAHFYAELSTNNYDHYTEEEFKDLFAYSDVNQSGYIDPVDASWISIKYAQNSTL